jgi:hypothetical protein
MQYKLKLQRPWYLHALRRPWLHEPSPQQPTHRPLDLAACRSGNHGTPAESPTPAVGQSRCETPQLWATQRHHCSSLDNRRAVRSVIQHAVSVVSTTCSPSSLQRVHTAQWARQWGGPPPAETSGPPTHPLPQPSRLSANTACNTHQLAAHLSPVGAAAESGTTAHAGAAQQLSGATSGPHRSQLH